MTTSFTPGQILFASQLLAAFGEKLGSDVVGAPNGLATLDAGGKIPVAQIPAIAINDVFVVGSEAAMLALDAQTGDVALRSDLSKSFILATNSPTTLADWKEVLVPAGGGVTDVAGKTGSVVLVASDISDAGATGILALQATTAAILTALLNVATTSVKGLAPQLSGNASEFLNGNGGWTTPVITAALPKGYLFPRAICANNGVTPNTKLDIAAGTARSSDDTTNISWGSTLTLDITATGANGLDVSGSRSASGTIHVFVIWNSTGPTVAAFGSASTTPTLPSGYTKSRRVGSFRLDASQNFRPFVAFRDRINYKTPVAEANVFSFGTTSALVASVAVPTSVPIRAALGFSTSSGYSGIYVSIKDPADVDAAVTTANFTHYFIGPINTEVGLNLSAQFRLRSDTGISVTGLCYGYIDPRDA